MRRATALLYLMVVSAGCKEPAGASCESWEECDSGVCGGGVCLAATGVAAATGACDEGYTSVSFDCGPLGCLDACRMACETSSECPAGHVCTESRGVDGSYCEYEAPRVVIVPGGPYSALVGEPIAVSVRATLPERFVIASEHSHVVVPPSARAAHVSVGSPRVEGDAYTIDAVFRTPGTWMLDVDVTVVDPSSAEELSGQVKVFTRSRVRVDVTRRLVASR